MFAAAIKDIATQVDQRFALNAFLPVLAAGFAAVLLWASAHDGVDALLEWWGDAGGSLQALVAAGSLAAAYFVGSVVATNWRAITMLYEGYGWPERLAAPWRARHRARAAHMDVRTEVEARYLAYPVTTHPPTVQVRGGQFTRIMPTRIGNALRAAEDYGDDRYGMPTVLLWPRLHPLLPEDVRSAAAGARAAMEFSLVVSLLGGSLALFAAVLSLAFGLPVTAYLAGTIGGAVAFVAGRAAGASAAVGYGEHLRAAIDLHRHELISGLGLAVPTTADEERRLWERVARATLGGGRVPLPQHRTPDG